MKWHLSLLFKDILTFWKKDFSIPVYGYTVIIIAISIVLVYTNGPKEIISNAKVPTSNPLINNAILFLFMYYVILIPDLLIRKEHRLFTQPVFWIKPVLFVSLLAIADKLTICLPLNNLTPLEESYLCHKIVWRLRNLMVVFPVILFYRFFFDKNINGLYGVCRGNHPIKAYLFLYLLILPILIVTSFTPDFLSYYPSFKPWMYGRLFSQPIWLTTTIYEMIYMMDFFMVELIFRGVLVIGMSSLFGRNAILPMVSVYVTLHFGKPVLETISAIFGGYCLGALSYQSKHIWGGIIIHMGIALIIEILRFFQHYLLNIG